VSTTRGTRYFALGAPLFAILSACHNQAPLTAQQAEGKHLYSTRCAHCHEDNDLALQKVPPNLQRIFARPMLPSGLPASDENVQSVVLNGKGMMPGFTGRFSQDEMSDLLAYLHTGLR
jgi:cytochrome c2